MHRAPSLLLPLLLAATLPAAAASSSPATAPSPLIPGDHWRSITVDGRERTYLVHVPRSYDRRAPTPAVLIFHGATMNAAIMPWFCGMDRTSERAGFIAVYPNGTGLGSVMLTFNAWALPGASRMPDDVKFTARLLDDLATVANIDAKRVYATGISNGGMICHRLAAEMSDRIAAIASISGTIAIERVEPRRPVPVLHFHGTADTLLPYNGPTPAIARFLPFKSVEETIATWVRINGCEQSPRMTTLADTAHDGTRIQRKEWTAGRHGAPVILYTIEGGGHTWPGEDTSAAFLGKVTMNIHANDVIWEFFLKHPMKP